MVPSIRLNSLLVSDGDSSSISTAQERMKRTVSRWMRKTLRSGSDGLFSKMYSQSFKRATPLTA